MTDEPRQLIKGRSLNLGGEDYVIPPLNLEQLEEFAETIDQLSEPLPAKAQRPLQLRLIHAALTRNYPKISLRQVKQMLDLGNILEAYLAVMGVSGFVPAGKSAPGE